MVQTLKLGGNGVNRMRRLRRNAKKAGRDPSAVVDTKSEIVQQTETKETEELDMGKHFVNGSFTMDNSSNQEGTFHRTEYTGHKYSQYYRTKFSCRNSIEFFSQMVTKTQKSLQCRREQLTELSTHPERGEVLDRFVEMTEKLIAEDLAKIADCKYKLQCNLDMLESIDRVERNAARGLLS